MRPPKSTPVPGKALGPIAAPAGRGDLDTCQSFVRLSGGWFLGGRSSFLWISLQQHVSTTLKIKTFWYSKLFRYKWNYIEISHSELLVGGFNPFEKYARQIRSFPPSADEHKKYWKPPPRLRSMVHMAVSKNGDTPKWMVKIMENPIKMDDLEGKPTIFGNTHFTIYRDCAMKISLVHCSSSHTPEFLFRQAFSPWLPRHAWCESSSSLADEPREVVEPKLKESPQKMSCSWRIIPGLVSGSYKWFVSPLRIGLWDPLPNGLNGLNGL